MDENEDEFEFMAEQSDASGSEDGEESETVQDVAQIDSWESFHERIDALIVNEHCEKSVQELDDERYKTLERVRKQMQEAPKSISQRCQAQKNQIEQQLEQTSTRLGQLVRFGNELVTNIRVANERRELERLQFEAARAAKIKERLRYENVQTVAKFADIKARWTELGEINEPMMLWEQIDLQKNSIAQIMSRKDEMIEACQQEIDRMNEKYEADQERQATDISCLVERVDHQIETLKESYKEHLQMLRHSIEDEHQLFSITAMEKWRSFFDALNANFDEKISLLKSRELFYAEQAQQINESQEELTKSTRIRLEKECERLELELRRTRDNVLMNSEKLDYNYQVLQKRNEENIIINNQQKRLVARLHEQIGRTRRKLKQVYYSGKQSIARLSADIYKLHSNINEMEIKAHHARIANKEKFDRVWEINYKELAILVNRVYDIDRVLHQQQLMIPWSKPDIDISNINIINRPNRRKVASEQYNLYNNKQQKNTPDKAKPTVNDDGGGDSDITELPVDAVRLMRNVMRKLSDRAGFLIEERLLKILEPYTEQDKCLVRIDNIFAALRVRHLRDIEELTRMFTPFTYCPNCQPEGLTRQQYSEVFVKDFVEVTISKYDQKLKKTITKDKKPESGERKTCNNHIQVMEPALILHAMNLYTNHVQTRLYRGSFSATMQSMNYIKLSDEVICSFWRKFASCFPESKGKMWKTLEHGLNHYVDVLKMREQYDTEVIILRRQHSELRHLLQKFKI